MQDCEDPCWSGKIMISNKEEWNDTFNELRTALKQPKNISIIIDLILDLHGFTHESVNRNRSETLEDMLWGKSHNFRSFNDKKSYSAAWHLWHSARIEDITCSFFVTDTSEIFDELEFFRKMNVPFRHTGNSLTLQQMQIFNEKIDLEELRNYRKEVGRKTQEGIKRLTVERLNEKIKSESLLKIQEMGSIAADDVWLLEYWGKKSISGILLMPLTRHLLVHLNSAMRMV